MQRRIPRSITLLLALLMIAMFSPSTHAAPTVYFTRYYSETGHNLFLPFLGYWDRMGGLPIFGFPKSEPFLDQVEGKWYMVQWFERGRLEWHCSEADKQITIVDQASMAQRVSWPPLHTCTLMGRVGVEALALQGRDWQTFPKGDPAAPHYFSETGHAIAPQFWGYWANHGLEFDGRPGKSFAEALALFGLPISEPQVENGYLTQWFERARFEWHPENTGTAYEVLLGLLGNELSAERGSEMAFQQTGALDSAHAAGMRIWLAYGTARGQPVLYRSDIQAIADQAATEFALHRRDPNHNIAQEINEQLKGYPPLATVAYLAAGPSGHQLALMCGTGPNPDDPVGSMISNAPPYVTDRTLTIGVYGPEFDSCGTPIVDIAEVVGFVN